MAKATFALENDVGTPTKARIEFDETLQRVLAQGKRNLQDEVVRLHTGWIIDHEGNLLKAGLPSDMVPGSDRDFGG